MNQQKKEQFEYKLSLIQKELETINNIIDKHDNFTQATKNWCVVIWIGTLSLILKEISNSDMMKLLFFTPVIPIMFWIIDATWRRLQNRSIYRSDKISEFLNSKDFTDSYSNYELKNFKIWDLIGKNYIEEEDYKKRTSFWRALKLDSIWRFYFSMVALSILIGVIVLFL